MAYDYVTTTGTVVADTSSLLADVQDEWKAAFGNDLIVTNETPQGVLIVAEVAARDAVARNNALLANQINPNLAGGIFLDAIWALTSTEGRYAATYSTISAVTLAGVPNSIVQAGTILSVGSNGAQFTTDSLVTLDAVTGTATVNVTAVETGPIACAVGALNTIVTASVGLETVTNTNAASLGRDEESDVSARYRRRQTLAAQSSGSLASTISALMSESTISSAIGRENTTNASASVDGITIPAFSAWFCVQGGTDGVVAKLILDNKSICGLSGSTTVNVTDSVSGQTYAIKFDRPTEVPLAIRVTAKFNNTDAYTVIPAAILSYASGELTGDPGLVIGSPASPFELAGAINMVEPRIQVTNVELSIDGGTTWSSSTIAIALNELATVQSSNISVISA